ncbi:MULTISPECIES: phage tail protein [Thalassospira]|uniref:Phage tail collar domain-containing protein n=2 Tax=Thalassospira TaxID=168934 RepID=A0A367WBM7_9PROT|nr:MULTISPECIES: phage tail protein [Thalassospira]MDG4718085.1 phage tail protein [Thalassospira sp. FZY0004]RCK37860.1 hypothetical protein TH19_07455 [Thalassospira profundimaris]
MSSKTTVCAEIDIQQLANFLVPIASIHAFASQIVPSGYLVCDGSEVSRIEYSDLFAAIGTVWGTGDGTSTFNLPDLRGEFVRGLDLERGVDAGRVLGTSQGDEFSAHDHKNGIAEDALNLFVYGGSTEDLPGAATSTTDAEGHAIAYQGLTSSEGGSETRPRNIAVVFAIKASHLAG